MLAGLLTLAVVLYWFLPRPDTQAVNPATGDPRTLITVVGGFVERDRQMWAAVEDAFEHDHPDIDLKVLRGAGEPRKLDSMIAAGVAPDVFRITSDNAYQYITAGTLRDLTAFIDADPALRYDVGFDAGAGEQGPPPDYFDFSVAAFRLDNRLYALPMWYANFFVYYNKTLFDKYNVPYPDEDWDWAGFRDRCIALTRDAHGHALYVPERDSGGRIVTDDRGWTVYRRNRAAETTPIDFGLWFAHWQHGVENFIHQNGGHYIADRGLPTEHIDLANPAVYDALWFLYDLAIVKQCEPQAGVVGGAEMTSTFRDGHIGIMGPEGIFRLIDNRDKIRDFEWDVAPLPRGPTGRRASLVFPEGLGISTQCKHPAEAFTFVKWFSSRRGAGILSRWPLFIPPRRSIALSEDYFLDPSTAPESDWAMVHDVSYPWTDPQTGQHRLGYTFLAEAASVRFRDVYELISNGVGKVFYYRDFTDDQFKAFQAQHRRPPDDAEALALHRAALDQAIASISRDAERAYRWAQRQDESGTRAASWQLWAPLAVALVVAVGFVFWRTRRTRYQFGPLERRQQHWGYLLISPWLLGLLCLTAGPMLFSIGLSLCRWQSLGSLHDVEYIGVDNYVRALRGDDPLYYQSLKATAQYSLVSVPLLVVGGLALALLMNTRVRGIHWWRTFYFVPSILPIVAVVVLYFYLFDPTQGWVNHILRLLGWDNPPRWTVSADPVVGIPAAMWIFILMSLWTVGGSMIIYLGSLQGIPTQLYEAAEVDGAGKLRQLRHVTLPMISPVLFFMLIMGIIGSFQVFTNAYVFFESDGGPRNATLFYALHLFNEAINRYRFGYGAALAWLLFGVILLLTVAVFKSSPLWVYYEGTRERKR